MGPQVSCTLKGVERRFVQQYSMPIAQVKPAASLNEKIGAFALITVMEGKEAQLAGISFTLDGSTIQTFLVKPGEGARQAVCSMIAEILQQPGIWGTTFYSHELGAEDFIYLGAALAERS